VTDTEVKAWIDEYEPAGAKAGNHITDDDIAA